MFNNFIEHDIQPRTIEKKLQNKIAKILLETLHHFWCNVNVIKIIGVKMIDKKYIGSNFDDFLNEEGVLQETEAIAIKRVILSFA